MKAIVKIYYMEGDPFLKLATKEGFEHLELEEGDKLEYEVSSERRCTGYHKGKGDQRACPEFREIKKGDQCQECRSKDIYSGWRQGNSSPSFEADYSVYIVQSGDAVKVGVTRSDRVESRWLEQGADYGAVIYSGLTGDEALEKENKISESGVSETIRKERKVERPERDLIENRLEDLGYRVDIVDMSKDLSGSSFSRDGRFPSPIESVKGQIVSNGRTALGLTSGKTLEAPRQKGLDEY